MIEIGPFHDLSPGPHLKNTAELAAFKISLETLPDQVFRITGWCHESKEELKHFLKKLDQYIDPQQLGEQMGLWYTDNILKLAKSDSSLIVADNATRLGS